MPITPTKQIWMDGEFVNWDDATIHILNPSLHYGWGVFEGIRAYSTDRGPAVFRLTEHIQRLFRSAHIYMMKPEFNVEQIVEATKELVRRNEIDSCYIRPLFYLGYGEMGLNPLPSRTAASIACWPWGAYLGDEATQNGVRAAVSSTFCSTSSPFEAFASMILPSSKRTEISSISVPWEDSGLVEET